MNEKKYWARARRREGDTTAGKRKVGLRFRFSTTFTTTTTKNPVFFDEVVEY